METNSTISEFYTTRNVDYYDAIDSNGEPYRFYSGLIYNFEVEPFKKATYMTSNGVIEIPIDEFSNKFMTEKDNFDELERKLESDKCGVGGRQNIYATYLSPYIYRIFINAYPVKDCNDEWVLPEHGIEPEKPMFSFDTVLFPGSEIIDKHPYSPVRLSMVPQVCTVRSLDYEMNRKKDDESKLRRLEEKIKSGLTLKDYLKSFKNRNFSYCRGKGKRGATTDIRFGKYPKYVRIQFVRYFDGYRYGFTVETNENIYFFDIKHDYKWRPYFHKQKNDHTKSAL